jgi:hypothetical protein
MANRPQSLSKGQQEEVVRILHRRLLAYFLTALAIIGGVMGVGLWQIKERLEQKMESMIADQFQELRIRQTVSEVAATKAQDLLIKQIQPEVDAFKVEIGKKTAEADGKLSEIQQSVVKAFSTLSEIETMSEFMMTVLAAQNDDRKAFDKLEELSKQESHRFSTQAKRAWTSILDAHSSPLVFGPGDVPWREDLDPSKLSLSELRQTFQSAPDWIRAAILKYVWNRQAFSKIDRLDFMMQVMRTDSSLDVVEHAGRFFTQGTDQKIKPLAVSHLSDWWEEHRQEFIEKDPQNTQPSAGAKGIPPVAQP